ncbi:MAG: transcription-repair coupling factor [Bacteroidales bacterium]
MKYKNVLNINECNRLYNSVLKGNSDILIEGLYSSAKAFLLSYVIKEGLHLIVLNNKQDASACVNDLYQLVNDKNVFYLPSTKIGKYISQNKDDTVKVQRTVALGALNDYINKEYNGEYLILVAYKDSIEEKVLDIKSFKESVVDIKKGDNLSHEFIKELLYDSGFEKKDFVSAPGEYAIRGGIIDVFSFGDNVPYRIDFFGNEIESIFEFNVNTQRSTKEKIIIKLYSDINEIKENKSVDFISTLPKECIIWLSDVEKPKIQNKVVYLSTLSKIQNVETFIFNTIPQPSFNKQFDLLSSDIENKQNEGYNVFILSENINQIERLKSIFSINNLNVTYLNFTIQEGFIDHDSKICLYTDHQIFERYRRVKLKKVVEKSERLTINELNAYKVGDYIVHMDHGVGKFGGLVKNNVNGNIQEAVKIIYKDNDVIFVNINNLHRISKYKSADSIPPHIHKLGRATWEKIKSQTKSRVKDIAQDLIKLYAQRKASDGFSFSSDLFLQNEFDSLFKYEETEDQMKSIKAVNLDMEKPYPMDRLICGDVGFGKTEVSMRAAFKAVANSKQVVMLVPTTILALQHYNTFVKRFKNFPINIDYLCRLRTTKEINQITNNIKSGKIEIIIGTHGLLNKKIQYKDLGLLIIDEEQKFGVSAKEKLRQLKLSVDTLTLSATPIPRTLQFSLLGARDLSIIATPPPNRIPIHTEIIDNNKEFLKEIIEEELERGGQIFFVHNKVKDILDIEQMIQSLCPEAKTCVIHGKMDPKVLEKKILDYMVGDYDILIATTIIENGIDIPNTNTIIIDQAQNYGLSDLHQLRGRVGRSDKQAFCYLITPPTDRLTDDARRRLNAIEAFSDLGSGFNIAMQDLDIRGMGNMLGAEQSGYISNMGFETYQKILEEAFEEIKTENDLEEDEEATAVEKIYVDECTLETDKEMLIPDSYINIINEKIRIYKRLDSIEEEKDIKLLSEEMEDRYGPIPDAVNQLFFVVRLRKLAKELGFEKLALKNNRLLMYFFSDSSSEYFSTDIFQCIVHYIQEKSADRYILKQKVDKLYLIVNKVNTIEGVYNLIKKMYYICRNYKK